MAPFLSNGPNTIAYAVYRFTYARNIQKERSKKQGYQMDNMDFSGEEDGTTTIGVTVNQRAFSPSIFLSTRKIYSCVSCAITFYFLKKEKKICK